MYSYMAYNLLVFEFIWMNKFKFDVFFLLSIVYMQKKELALIA